jgi:uncharacterized glyoxalase superfamily metalloenzyme YdcJ
MRCQHDRRAAIVGGQHPRDVPRFLEDYEAVSAALGTHEVLPQLLVEGPTLREPSVLKTMFRNTM